MKIILLTLLFIAACTATEYQTTKNGITILDDSNFEKAREEFDYIVVKFTRQNCHWCRDYKPIFEATNQLMKRGKYNVLFATVDCTYNRKTKIEQGISFFPATRLYVKKGDHVLGYRSKRSPVYISQWVTSVIDYLKSHDEDDIQN